MDGEQVTFSFSAPLTLVWTASQLTRETAEDQGNHLYPRRPMSRTSKTSMSARHPGSSIQLCWLLPASPRLSLTCLSGDDNITPWNLDSTATLLADAGE